MKRSAMLLTTAAVAIVSSPAWAAANKVSPDTAAIFTLIGGIIGAIVGGLYGKNPFIAMACAILGGVIGYVLPYALAGLDVL